MTDNDLHHGIFADDTFTPDFTPYASLADVRVGDSIRVTGGSFETFTGKVENVANDGIILCALSIFGHTLRTTLTLAQIGKRS